MSREHHEAWDGREETEEELAVTRDSMESEAEVAEVTAGSADSSV